MEYMGINNTVKVTREDHSDHKRIGVIKSKENDFVIVDFGTHENKHNISNLIDLSI